MKIVMVSNGLSHHQIPVCDYFASQQEVDFTYIATKPISSERLGMGYTDYHQVKPYVLCSYNSNKAYSKALELINQADFVICGSVPLKMVIWRILQRKYIFWASERIFKTKKINWKQRLFCILTIFCANKTKSFLLAASAYSSMDFSHFGLPGHQMLKWGYFPPILCNEIKEKQPASIIWVGRFICWKHPELVLKLAKELKSKGIDFHLSMIGDGPLAEDLKAFVFENGLDTSVSFLGFRPNEEIHKIMAASQILVATSDEQEGWGAVINEGMGHGCAVVASKAMGAPLFLIKNGINGFLFESGNLQELTIEVEKLLKTPELMLSIGENAQDTIRKVWNGNVAGERLLKVFKQLYDNETLTLPSDDVCSLASIDIPE